MKKQLMTFLLCGSLFATAQQPVDYVNPFIGTSNYGTTNPGAVCPQGMMSVPGAGRFAIDADDGRVERGL